MANSERHGAKGKMHLKHVWEESSSGHIEDFEDIELAASDNGDSVILTEKSGSKNFIRYSESGSSVSEYEISVTDLIQFIKDKGRRTQ